LLVNNSVNTYDLELWAMAQALWGDQALADKVTERLNSNRSGDLADIRGKEQYFTYNGKKFGRTNGLFFRMLTDHYVQVDPMYNKTPLYSFPDPHIGGTLHHVDWKPILGENAWVILGEVQIAYKKYKAGVPLTSAEIKAVQSLIDVSEAMQSPIGAFYHAP